MSTKNVSTQKFNTVEVEFYYQDFTRNRRKIAIPHGQFSPPSVLHDSRSSQWFTWCSRLGVYQETAGEILSNVEVTQ